MYVHTYVFQGLGFGNVAKVYLSFEEPWWPRDIKSNGFTFLWKDEDIAQLENDVRHLPLFLYCVVPL